MPRSGMRIELLLPAKMVKDLLIPTPQTATPLPSTVAPGLMNPSQNPDVVPVHHTISRSTTGFDDSSKMAVAVNCTCPLGKLFASATAGLIFIEVRSLPQPDIRKRRSPVNAVVLAIRQPRLRAEMHNRFKNVARQRS